MMISDLHISGAVLDALFFVINQPLNKQSPELFAENTEIFSSFGMGGVGRGWTPICHVLLQWMTQL